VNKEKNYEIANESILNTYKQYSLIVVFNDFIRHFSDKNKGTKLIAGSLFRHGITINLKKWFQENINKFEL
jgi:tRNA A22 N-methylase